MDLLQKYFGWLVSRGEDVFEDELEKEEQEFNVDEELKKMIISEKNRQFNEFSIIHFKKIEQQIFINEK